MPEDDDAVRRDVTVPAAPEDVWEALATEEGLEGWLADEVKLDLREGGEGVFRYPDGEERHAVVERVEEGRSIVLRWRREGCETSRVLLEVEGVPAGARVRVVEWGLGPTASAAPSWSGPLGVLERRTFVAWAQAATFEAGAWVERDLTEPAGPSGPEPLVVVGAAGPEPLLVAGPRA